MGEGEGQREIETERWRQRDYLEEIGASPTSLESPLTWPTPNLTSSELQIEDLTSLELQIEDLTQDELANFVEAWSHLIGAQDDLAYLAEAQSYLTAALEDQDDLAGAPVTS